MKLSKFFAGILIASAMAGAVHVEAASFGRSSSVSVSRSSSYSSPSRSYSAPSPSRFGGSTSSMGVRKSDVTAPVANSVQSARTVPVPSYSAPRAPSYSTTPTPSYSAPVPTPSVGGGFWSSFGGSMAGSAVGNALFGNHSQAPVIVNGGAVPSASVGSGVGTSASPLTSTYAQPLVPQKSYGIGDFIIDVILFVIALGVVAGAAYLIYRGYKMSKTYVNRERGVVLSTPIAPTSKFWEIQNAFAEADKLTLLGLLGPDMVTEATHNLTKFDLKLSNVSYAVVLNNPREFSVHYTFNDDGEKVDQVWHYELHDNVWKLNGLETI